MPNLITHKIFGDDVAKLVNTDLKHFIETCPQAFSVGTSGPDFLFYYKRLPWHNKKQSKKVQMIASCIHQININQWYKHAINICQQEENLQLKSQMISFLIGHITHWGLDHMTHPFIFYRSESLSQKNSYWHFRYESMLDTVMANNYKKKSISQYNSQEIMATNDQIEQAIYKIYKNPTEKTCDIDFKYEYVVESFKSAQIILKLLHDPKGLKSKVVSLFEILLNKRWSVTSHMVTDKIKEAEDVLNLKNTTWKNPANPGFTSNESFLDLYYRAIEFTVLVLDEFDKVLKGKSLDDFLALIDNKSYETGLSEYYPMIEFNSIY